MSERSAGPGKVFGIYADNFKKLDIVLQDVGRVLRLRRNKWVIRNFTPDDFAPPTTSSPVQVRPQQLHPRYKFALNNLTPVTNSPSTTCNGGEFVAGEVVPGVKLLLGEKYTGVKFRGCILGKGGLFVAPPVEISAVRKSSRRYLKKSADEEKTDYYENFAQY